MSRHPKEKRGRAIELKPPITYPKYSWQVKTKEYFDFKAPFKSVMLPNKLQTTQKWIRYPTRCKIDFPLQTVRPKVQKIRVVEPLALPKDVAVERKRKQYEKVDFDALLKDMGIENVNIYPVKVLEKIYPEGFKAENIFKLKNFLPLHWFDDKELDSYNEEGWLDLGKIEGEQHPLPAMGFVPNLPFESETKQLIENEAELLAEKFNIDPDGFDTFHDNLYVWRLIAVRNYDEATDLWSITDLETFKSFQLHRIYIRFIAEDPVSFVCRLKRAIEMRNDQEEAIKCEIILDTLLYQTKCSQQSFIEQIIEKIFAKTVVQKVLQRFSEDQLKSLRDQVRLQVNRHNTRYDLLQYVAKQAEFKFLNISGPKTIAAPKSFKLQRMIDDLDKRKESLMFCSLYFCQEVVNATIKVVKECLHLQSLSLFSCSKFKPITLDEFVAKQQYHVAKNVNFIKGLWVDDVAYTMYILLRRTGKGCMDVHTKDWFIFNSSKLNLFLRQVKLRMQDSLQHFLQFSIDCFTDLLCGPCVVLLNIDDAHESAESSFKVSTFESPSHSPIFDVTICMCENGACLSTDSNDFLPALTNLFHSSLVQCTTTPAIDSKVMINLVHVKNVFLNCGDQIEELYHSKMELLRRCYAKAIIPLQLYTRKYDQFQDLYFLSVADFIADLRAKKQSATALKEMILNHKRLRTELMETLPTNTVIGPFSLNCETIRTALANKYEAIVEALLVFFTDRLHDINSDLLESLTTMYNKIAQKPISIEHLYEIRDYIGTAPKQLQSIEERIRIMNYEYDVLDSFLYNLSNEQFEMKWQACGYPPLIRKLITKINEQHKLDIEAFKKVQVSELAVYSEHLESINQEVSQFGYIFDIRKVEENAADARKLWKIIQDAEKKGEILSKRQELFEMDANSLESITSVKENFQPYFDLWNTCLSIVKLEEVCIGNPMHSLDMTEIKKQFEAYTNVLESLHELFQDKLEIQQIATAFCERIADFSDKIVILECLKDEHWLLMHWQELNAKAKIEIKYSQNISLGFCMKKGIMKHVQLVKEICTRAVEEADSIQQALEEAERRKIEETERLLSKKKSRKCRTDVL